MHAETGDLIPVAVAATGLSRVFPDGDETVVAIGSVDLELRFGELVVLHGHSGSGKSTLLRLLSGIDVPTSGEVAVGDVPLGRLSEDERARIRLAHIGVVYQTDNLIEEFTAHENVTFPLRVAGWNGREADTEADTWLERVGVADLGHRYPEHMSGGQRQRVGIARALAGGRRTLLADEPTGALDTMNSSALMALLRALADEGVAVLVSSHDPAAQLFGDRAWRWSMVFSPDQPSRLRASVLIVRYLLRRRLWLGPALIVAGVVSLVCALHASVSAWSLSPRQLADRDLGRFHVSYAVNPSGEGYADPAWYTDLAADVRGAVSVDSVDVMPAVAEPPPSTYREMDWGPDTFTTRYRLLAGHLPRSADEVVVSEPTLSYVTAADRLDVVGGARLEVVGVVDDRFSNGVLILAAPGTWAKLRARSMHARPMDAIVRFFSPDPAAEVLPRTLASIGRSHGLDVAMQAIHASGTDAASVAAGGRNWLDRIPFAFLVPGLLFPFLAGANLVTGRPTRHRRLLRRMIDLGVPGRLARLSLLATMVIVSVIACSVGSLIGDLLAGIVRPLLARWSPQELSAIPRPWWVFMRAAVGSCVAILVFGQALRSADVTARLAPGRAAFFRRLALLGDGFACAGIALAMHSMTGAMLLVSGVAVGLALATPDIVTVLARGLPRRTHAQVLIRSQIDRGRASAGAWVFSVALLVGLPLSLLAMIASAASTSEASMVAAAAPDQLVVAGGSGTLSPPTRGVVRVLEREGLTDPIRLGYLGTLRSPVTAPGQLAGVWAVESVADVEPAFGAALTDEQRRALSAGGMLSWVGLSSGTRLSDSAGHALGVAVRSFAPDPAWAGSDSGVVLAATARAAGIQVTSGPLVYAGVDPERARHLRELVARAGYDPYEVRFASHRSGELAPIPVFVTACGLFALLVFASATIAGVRARSMRRFVGTLLQLGIPWGWTRRLLVREQAVLLGLGLTLVGVLVLTGLGAAMLVLDSGETRIPVLPTVAVLLALAGSVAAGTAVSLRSVRALEGAG